MCLSLWALYDIAAFAAMPLIGMQPTAPTQQRTGRLKLSVIKN